jgi:hypothetical protein
MIVSSEAMRTLVEVGGAARHTNSDFHIFFVLCIPNKANHRKMMK